MTIGEILTSIAGCIFAVWLMLLSCYAAATWDEVQRRSFFGATPNPPPPLETRFEAVVRFQSDYTQTNILILDDGRVVESVSNRAVWLATNVGNRVFGVIRDGKYHVQGVVKS